MDASATLVTSTVVVVVGSNEAKKLVSGKPTTALAIRPVVGGFFLGLGLFALVAMNEPVGHAFCTLLIIGAVLVNGAPILNKLTN